MLLFRCVGQLHPTSGGQGEDAGGGEPAAHVTGKY